MGLFNTNKEQKALQKIKKLQMWLNRHFPEELPMEPMDDYKFIEAEDFLTEEARRWKDAQIKPRG